MIEFVVLRKPLVLGADPRSKAVWKDQVRQAAPRPDGLLEGPLCLRIDYFFRAVTDLDTDNMIKPIQDALEGYLYDNDRMIDDVCARKINLTNARSTLPEPQTFCGPRWKISGATSCS